MANCPSNCSGCARSYGALNSLYTCRNYPYYTGPCPPASCSGCPCGTPNEPEPATAGAVGAFYALGPITTAANGAIPFTAGPVNPCYFALNGTSITIRQTGVYRATYTANIPADTPTNTAMTLALNGTAITASGVNVETATGATSASFTGQALFAARAGDVLTLNASSALTLPASTHPIFTLILERVG